MKKGGHHTAEAKAKMSVALSGRVGRKHTEESKHKISEANKGRIPTAATRAKMSESAKRKPPMTAEHRAKIAAASKGRKHTAETRHKMRDAQRNMSPEAKAAKSAKLSKALKGKKFSAEHCRKLSEVRKGKKKAPFTAEHKQRMGDARRGPKHYRWKGGHCLYGPGWKRQRKLARRRDNDICQLCGITKEELGHELSVHHVRPFRESRDNSIENLICLCDRHNGGTCHVHCETHPEDCPEPRKHWLLTA